MFPEGGVGRPPPFSSLRQGLHWFSAAIILWLMLSGFAIVFVERGTSARAFVDMLNPGLGVILAPPFLLRTVLWLRSLPFHGWASKARDERATIAGQACLYLCVWIVLLSGVLMMADGWSFLGIVQVRALPAQSIARMVFSGIHLWADIVLALLMAGHIALVAVHEARGRPVLYRVLSRLDRTRGM
ncbi:MAG: cytochrome b/b6 domain-containing protein [Gluconacetobacter sp.]|mgnify:FL=1